VAALAHRFEQYAWAARLGVNLPPQLQVRTSSRHIMRASAEAFDNSQAKHFRVCVLAFVM
jgi:hypothetical protein